MFLARVAAGKVFDVHGSPPPGTPVPALRIPSDTPQYLQDALKGKVPWDLPAPIRTQGPAAFLTHAPLGHHSVQGNVGGPLNAYVVYEPIDSYPAYLVTYKSV